MDSAVGLHLGFTLELILNETMNCVVRIQFGSPHWKHSELFFEKKGLIPEIQRFIAAFR